MEIAPVSAARSIPYPSHDSEFEVQAWLYMALREAGFDVRGEVKTLYAAKCRKTRAKAQFCRFDLVIYEAEVAARVLEVKAAKVGHKGGTPETTRQGTRYPTFGVPVSFVYGMDGARDIFDRLLERRKTTRT
jgi:hypothetical protein